MKWLGFLDYYGICPRSQRSIYRQTSAHDNLEEGKKKPRFLRTNILSLLDLTVSSCVLQTVLLWPDDGVIQCLTAGFLFSTNLFFTFYLIRTQRWGFPPVNSSSWPSSPLCWLVEGSPPCIISCRVSVYSLFFVAQLFQHCSLTQLLWNLLNEFGFFIIIIHWVVFYCC